MNPTALDILEKNGVKIFGAHQERILAAMREIAERSFDAGKERGIAEEVEDTCGFIQNQPDKEDFLKELFPEK